MAVVLNKTNNFKIDIEAPVKLKTMGHCYEIMYLEHRKTYCSILMIDKDHFCKVDYKGNISDIYLCNHIHDRSESLYQVGQSLKRLRDYINTNVTNPKEWKWITLTYAENMTDTKRLYKDFQRFIRRVRNKYQNYNLEYIIACEPQARGAWHVHLLLWFGKIAPYVPNKTIKDLWSFGNVMTLRVNDIDNLGAYLSAYLGDMELSDENIKALKENGYSVSKNDLKCHIKELEIDGKKKKFIKGARLYMYPPKFNLYRISRGIKKPIVEEMEYFDAKLKVGFTEKPTYKKCVSIDDLDTHYHNTVAYEYYNTQRK